MSITKKVTSFALSLLLFVPLLSVFSTQNVYALGQRPQECPPFPTPLPIDGPWYDQNPCQYSIRVSNTENPQEIFGERYTFAQVNWIFNSLMIISRRESMKALIGLLCAPLGCPQVTTNSSQSNTDQLGSKSSNPTLSSISGVREVKSLVEKITFTNPVQAQGYGFGALDGIRPLWAASRNMAYLLMVAVLVISGFMVMFRVKINPQTAATIQMLIPRIVIGLVLVTFSYAIAGFVIDLLYLLLGFIIYAVATVAPSIVTDAPTAFATFAAPDLWGIFALLGILAFSHGSQIFPVIGPIIGLLMILVVIILLLRIFVMQIKAFVFLLLKIIAGPFIIMLGILQFNPNSTTNFVGWLRSVIAEAAVFLVLPLMLALVVLFWNPCPPGSGILGSNVCVNFVDIMNAAFYGIILGGVGALVGIIPFLSGVFAPILSGIGAVDTATLPTLPLFSPAGGGGFLRLMIGLGILAMTPKIADVLKELLKQPAFKYGTAIGEALGPATGIARAGFGGYAMPEIGGMIGGLPSTGRWSGPARNVLQSLYDYGRDRKWWSQARGTP